MGFASALAAGRHERVQSGLRAAHGAAREDPTPDIDCRGGRADGPRVERPLGCGAPPLMLAGKGPRRAR